MPEFTIETTYRIPVYRQRSYQAGTLAEACRLAIEDDDWEGQKEDYESAGETYVTGVWEGADTAYRVPALPVPPHFGETMQRQVAHFEVLLGLLKMLFSDILSGRPTAPEWLVKTARAAIARGEAILDGAHGPDEPADLPRPRHVLAELREDRCATISPPS
jgi:hypothetical protein